MSERKVTVVWLMNSMPPYRSSVCLRARRELKLDLVSAVTHDPCEGNRWPRVPQEVLPQVFFAPHQMPGPVSRGELAGDVFKAMKVLRWIWRVRPAAMIVYGYNDFTRMLAVAWCRISGTPVFVAGDSNIHGESRRPLIRALKSAYLSPLLRLTNGAMPHGSLGSAYFRKYGVPRSRIYRLPLEPDYASIAAVSADRIHSIATRLGFAPDRRRIVYSGRLVEVKRVDLLIQAFNRIAVQRPDWDLIVLGSGPLESQLRDAVAADLVARVQFVPAFRDPQDVFAVYRSCDVLVLPSDYEPWAIVINEAAASGLAMVCSDVVGAAADLLRDGVNGRSFRRGSLDGLTAALLDVTEPANLSLYKAASPQVVADWRRDADPVQGIARALRDNGITVG
ncbi:glycosyltransferase [Humisphaera borealis]|uniref:Glycosyltransferase n=1 Tax=Humisphaera borealis TaxID=2807512 RepID=A0A7M2WQJ3_9BACT|nr:glycosyltransferase [Humisphaera borealis]QOV87669.1 glycosyltransferase [Humisphaera borealis]